jgi:hypothetical protein
MLCERQISIWRLYFIKRALSESESEENEQEKPDPETGVTTSASHPSPDLAQFRSASPHSYSRVVCRPALSVSYEIFRFESHFVSFSFPQTDFPITEVSSSKYTVLFQCLI